MEAEAEAKRRASIVENKKNVKKGGKGKKGVSLDYETGVAVNNMETPRAELNYGNLQEKKALMKSLIPPVHKNSSHIEKHVVGSIPPLKFTEFVPTIEQCYKFGHKRAKE